MMIWFAMPEPGGRTTIRRAYRENCCTRLIVTATAGAVLDRLIDNAVALGQLEQLIELLLRRIGLDVETQANLRKADRGVLGDAERAAEIEIAFGANTAGLHAEFRAPSLPLSR